MDFEKIFIKCENLVAKGKPDLALKKVQSIINKAPRYPRIFQFGAKYAALLKKNKLAEEYYLFAIKHDNQNPNCYLNFGSFLQKRKKHLEAEKNFKIAYELDPYSVSIIAAFSLCLYILNKINKSKEMALKAYQYDPRSVLVNFLLSITYMRLENYSKAWEFFEIRNKQFENINERFGTNIFPLSNKWEGEDLSNKKLIILTEQGFGDFIMFFRFVMEIKQRFPSAKVGVVVEPELLRIFEETYKNIDFFSTNQALEEITIDADFWVSLLSTPFVLKVDKVSCSKFPYLSCRVNKNIPSDFISKNKPNIGLVWKGNPHHANDIFRSVESADIIKQELEDKKYNFISLQFDVNDDDLETIDGFALNSKQYISDFYDTAGIISELDLIISVDTSIVHLSGALNIPTWILLPAFDIDWRWPYKKNSSDWYPSAKIFVNDNNNWPELLSRVKKELDLVYSL